MHNRYVLHGGSFRSIVEARMHILCDTSSILLLIRIAPDMFIDERYECCTIQPVRDEIFRTQKFKSKYPWRDEYRNKIKCLSSEVLQKAEIQVFQDTISRLNELGTVNACTGKTFSLSHVDIRFLSCALAYSFSITTGDQSIKDFAAQQFSEIFSGSVSPLELINIWIEKKLIIWNEELHAFLSDWDTQHEHPQPKEQKRRFRRLTGSTYPGS